MFKSSVDPIVAWVSASRFRSGVVRYVATFTVMAAAIALASFDPLAESAWLIVIVAVLGCSWFGGIGPSFVAPLVVVFAVRMAQKGTARVFDFSTKELVDLAVFLLLTTAVGWSGEIRRRAQALARRQARQLREESLRKDRFLAILAHELRNPLAPLRSGLELLKMGGHRADTPPLRDVCGMMERQVNHLTRLIDDLLDLNRINTGKIELRLDRVPLGDVIQDAVDSSRPHMDAAGHQLNVTIDDPALILHADAARIAQILLNLLNNAAKFTARGGCVQLIAAQDGNTVEFRIRDNGMGIMPAMLPRIFEIFVQLDESRGSAHGGLGIGLNLVRSLAELHGGTVTCASDGPGKGSEFVVRLPILPGGASDQADPQPSAEKSTMPNVAAAPNVTAPLLG